MKESIIILRTLFENEESTQRDIAMQLGVSLGKTNKLIGEMVSQGQLVKVENSEGRGRNVSYGMTGQGKRLLERYRVDGALILASGFGSRFVPLTYETPKGLLEVFGERMIERQIRQLREAGIKDIAIMVGYLKEKFDYLIDKYEVRLIYNPEFADKNTLATMHHAKDFLKGRNCYILSSDNWIRNNVYHAYEADSWYAATFMSGDTKEWAMETGKNGAIKSVSVGGKDKWCMYGPVFFTKEFSDAFLPLVDAYYKMPGTEQFYWEDVFIRNIKTLPEMYINKRPEGEVYEFENLEELREFDEKYINDSGSKAMQLVSKIFSIPESEIVNIKCLKAGMTNKSWYFSVSDSPDCPEPYRGRDFICRIPGPGTEKLINRKQEGEVYKAVADLKITEELVYFNPDNGYKISRFYRGARNADYGNKAELKACMSMLKRLHNSRIELGHEFDFRKELLQYEKDIKEVNSQVPFEDYPAVRMQGEEVLDWLDSLHRPRTIAHVDSVKDNFIFTDEGLRMIDWEYAGMADPLVDLAMAAIYSYMSYEEVRELIDIYATQPVTQDNIYLDGKVNEGQDLSGIEDKSFDVGKEKDIRTVVGTADSTGNDAEIFGERGGVALKGLDREEAFSIVVAYMGMGGLLWALWGIYKMALGESFGDYTLKMYRYFKDSYKILRKKGKF